jgi:DNA-binding GntR family transcriptional regulator
MEALQAQPQTSAELAAQFGVSDRHIRRTIADLILEKKVTRTRDGRDFLYSLAAAVVEEDAATTTITGPAGTADNRGHNVRDRDLGHSSDTGETISDICGHDR